MLGCFFFLLCILKDGSIENEILVLDVLIIINGVVLFFINDGERELRE